MTVKLYLTTTPPANGDSIIDSSDNSGPTFVGDEPDESLACGACRKVLGKHISTRTLHLRFSVNSRLVVHCACGAYNVIPAKAPG